MNHTNTSTTTNTTTNSESAVFITDVVQEGQILTDNLDQKRTSAGLPSTADLEQSDQQGSFSAFANRTHTLENTDSRLTAQQPGQHHSRTIGGIARPLSPHRGSAPPRVSIRSPNSSEYTLVTLSGGTSSARLSSPPAIYTNTTKPNSPNQDLTQGNYISRRVLTPLEIQVQKMIINNPNEITIGKGVIGNSVKVKKSIQPSNPYGEIGKFQQNESDDEKDLLNTNNSTTATVVLGNNKVKFSHAMHDSIQLDANEKYIEMREINRKNRLLAAQTRIQDRMQLKESIENSENTATALADGMLNPEKLFKKPLIKRYNSIKQKKNNNIRILSILDFNQYVNIYGEILIDLTTHLSTESGVKVFSFKNKNVSLPNFEKIVNSYFKPWHFEHLIRIDIVGKFIFV